MSGQEGRYDGLSRSDVSGGGPWAPTVARLRSPALASTFAPARHDVRGGHMADLAGLVRIGQDHIRHGLEHQGGQHDDGQQDEQARAPAAGRRPVP